MVGVKQCCTRMANGLRVNPAGPCSSSGHGIIFSVLCSLFQGNWPCIVLSPRSFFFFTLIVFDTPPQRTMAHLYMHELCSKSALSKHKPNNILHWFLFFCKKTEPEPLFVSRSLKPLKRTMALLYVHELCPKSSLSSRSKIMFFHFFLRKRTIHWLFPSLLPLSKVFDSPPQRRMVHLYVNSPCTSSAQNRPYQAETN